MSSAPVRASEDQFLHYAHVESSRGLLLVVMSDLGVVDILRGHCKRQMLRDAVRRFPDVGFVPDHGARAGWVAAIVHRVETPRASAEIPIDLEFCYRRRAAS